MLRSFIISKWCNVINTLLSDMQNIKYEKPEKSVKNAEQDPLNCVNTWVSKREKLKKQ